ncbi:carbohydrate ABC transporter permease [Clostridium sp. 19966]|uniref:carbohydrate ABC transporter permease n=1 Tax=Clostridium sp. 19966 TaxID=2768166 RepID=UPI0028DEE565|nr:carbohydrate ABC transporter permease [Clostridium sp. 19966]MDT8718969.1 carbohydrate ABC transporter permease [Clostridium sp. 19966]
MEKKLKRHVAKIVLYLLLIIGSIIMVLPFYWMVTTSLKTPSEIVKMPPMWIPISFKWSNFVEAWHAAPFPRYFLNSVIVTLLSTGGELITSILAAYAFYRLEFYGKKIIFSIMMGTMMIPGEMLLMPNFVTLTNLGWMNSYKALIVPWIASVFSIFMFTQYFSTIGDELYYAAKIDGSKDFRYLTNIIVPISKPMIITIAIIRSIGSWNSFMWPLIVTNSDEMRTLSVGLTAFITDVGTSYQLLMAASTFIILPMIILFLAMQKYIIEGVSHAGIKG